MSYRPICDVWIMARAKLKPNPDGSKNSYYGAYLGGFPERARAMLGVTLNDSVLHVCGGKARLYPYSRGFGQNDKTLDINPSLNPDYLHDIRKPFSPESFSDVGLKEIPWQWPAILADPPYSETDADSYATGRATYPTPNLLLKNCVNAVRIGGRVGILHYIWPSPPKNAVSIAAVAVLCGFNNRVRLFSVFERIL